MARIPNASSIDRAFRHKSQILRHPSRPKLMFHIFTRLREQRTTAPTTNIARIHVLILFNYPWEYREQNQKLATELQILRSQSISYNVTLIQVYPIPSGISIHLAMWPQLIHVANQPTNWRPILAHEVLYVSCSSQSKPSIAVIIIVKSVTVPCKVEPVESARWPKIPHTVSK